MKTERSFENIIAEFDLLSLPEKLQEVKKMLGDQASYVLPDEKTITRVSKESYSSFLYKDPQDELQRARNDTRDVTRYTIYVNDGSLQVLTIRQSRLESYSS